MATKKIFRWGGKYFLRQVIVFLFLIFVTTSCHDDTTPCDPWITWKFTFNGGVTQDQISVDKAASEQAINDYLAEYPKISPNQKCTATFNWSNTDLNYDFKVCLECVSTTGGRIDTVARPPVCGPKPPPGILNHASVNTGCPR